MEQRKALKDWKLTAWGSGQTQEHTSLLEMRAVKLALAAFLPQLSGQSVFLISDNASVVAYLWHHGGTVSWRLCLMVPEITQWTERHSVQLEARCIPGRNILADQLSCPDQVLPTEWSLLSQVFEGICSVLRLSPSRPVCHSGKHKASALRVSSSRSHSLEAGCSSSTVGHSVRLCLPSFCAAPPGSPRVLASEGLLLVLVAHCGLRGSGSLTFHPFLSWNPSNFREFASTTSREEVSLRPRDPPFSRVEVIQRIIRKAGFSRPQALHGCPLPIQMDQVPWLV